MNDTKRRKQQRSQVMKAVAESRELVALHEELVATLSKVDETDDAARKALQIVRFNHSELLRAVLGVQEPADEPTPSTPE